MRPVPAPAFLRALRLLLPLAACGLAPAVATPIWSNPDELVHLYTSNARKSLYLQFHSDGRVDGTRSMTVDSAVIIKPVRVGYVSINGPRTGLFLCMRRNGKLFGSRSLSNEDCVFKHTLLENHLDVYESVKHNLLVSLGTVKGPFVPSRKLPRFSEFLTRRNEIPLSQFYTPVPQEEDTRDDGDNPCGGILAGKIPEEMPLVGGIHPCFLEGEEERDPLGVTVRKRFPSARTG